jgi:hypothetical protein
MASYVPDMQAISVFGTETAGIYRPAEVLQLKEKIAEELSGGALKYQAQLVQLQNECEIENWDGYGALALEVDTVNAAKTFFSMLPYELARAELTVDPSGEVSAEWYFRPTSQFSVSISSAKKLTYAGILDDHELSGSLNLRDRIPNQIIDSIRQVCLRRT